MPQRWGIWLRIDGDLRFLSHRQTISAIERAMIRASVPIRFTQGFNPHPICSLACPRPVAVASDAELLVVSLEDSDEAMTGEQLVDSLNSQAPTGMTFMRAEALTGKISPQPSRINYDLPLDQTQVQPCQDRLAQLRKEPDWPVARRTGRSRSGRETTRTIDIKPLVAEMRIEKKHLYITSVARDHRWARPGEMLSVLGLDPRIDLARMRRTNIEYDFAAQAAGGA